MADIEHSLKTYLSDMLALEEHVRVPFETQVRDRDVNEFPEASELVMRIAALAQTHIDALKDELKRLGGHEAAGIKDTVATVEGYFAGAIDKLRKTKVSKSLRDDYTALALCAISYTMLHATATALAEMGVASLAERHLQEYALAITEIGDAVPSVVVKELRDIGLTVDTSAIERSRAATRAAWRTHPDRTTTGT
ncbi:MAG: hypothetical protein ACXWNK_16180 [Vulcanimicrobiaceae bacterium]